MTTTRSISSRIDRSLSTELHQAVEAHRDAVAMEYYGDAWTFAALGDEVGALAGGLRELGVRPGDRVALYAHNVPELLSTFLAVARLGAIAVGVNPQLTTSEAGYIVANSGADVIVASGDTVERAGQLASPARAVVLVPRWSAREAGGAAPSGVVPYRDLLAGDIPPDQARGDAPLAIFYTSGTTGRPKGAVWSHAGFLFGCLAPWAVMQLDGPRVTLKATNLMAVGLGATCLGPMLMGSAVHLLRKVSPREIHECIRAHGVSFVATVPSVLRLLFTVMREEQAPTLDSIEAIQLGGSPPNSELFASVAEHCPRATVFPSYAASEGWVSMARADASPADLGSAGRALPETEVAVLDRLGAPVATGGRGLVGFRGPGTMLGYWQDDDATARATVGGFLTAGDLGHLDGDGLLWLDGRDSEVIISGGYNVYASEVEGVLLDVPGVDIAAVVGEPDPILGERVVAYVVAPRATVDELTAACELRLAHYKHPRAIRFVDQLPTNALGKVQKHMIAAQDGPVGQDAPR